MLLSKSTCAKFIGIAASILMLAACTFRPVYSENTGNKFALEYSSPANATDLALIEELKFRLGQSASPQFALETKLSTATRSVYAVASQFVRPEYETTVRVSYVLKDNVSGEVIKKGERFSTALYQQNSQNIANSTALADANKRAAKDVARQIALLVTNALNERQP